MAQIIFIAIFLFTLVIRLFSISNANFAFTIDQARDMLEIRKLAVGHDPVFIGPVTSIVGVYLGPFWYYFNLLPFIVSHGNPASLVVWQIIFYYLVIYLFWWYFNKSKPNLAFWGGLFLLLSPRLFEATSYSFNANSTPAFVLLTLLLLYHTLKSKKPLFIFLLGLLVGLTLQIEAAFGILLLPLVIFWLCRHHLKKTYLFLIAFAITLAPQVLFEVKHQFMMTKTFITAFTGGDILGDKLPFLTRLMERMQNYYGVLLSTFPFAGLTLPLIVFILVIFIFHKKVGLLARLGFSLLVISLIVYLIYPNHLKDWWTLNFAVIYLLIAADILSHLRSSLLITLILAITLAGGLSFYQSKLNQKLTQRSNDPALLLNQLDAITWIYQDAKGEGFKVYDYVPAIYDYNYQYLFWWYGQKQFGYLPSTVTYQDGVPEYIDNNSFYWRNGKSGPQTYLIIENDPNRPQSQAAWLDHFKDLCRAGEKIFPWSITVKALHSCGSR